MLAATTAGRGHNASTAAMIATASSSDGTGVISALTQLSVARGQSSRTSVLATLSCQVWRSESHSIQR